METDKVIIDKESFCHFVYPFLFESEEFDKRVEAFNRAEWSGKKGTLNFWKNINFPSEDFLPCVSNYLNPPPNTVSTANLWTLDKNILQSSRGLGGRKGWELQASGRSIPFIIEDVELALFRIGVGFLTVRAKPSSNQFNDWVDFLHFFRFIKGQRKVSVEAKTKVGLDPETNMPQYESFFPNFTQEVNSQQFFGDVLDQLLRKGNPRTKKEPWWNEVFIKGQMIPFTTIFINNMIEQDIPNILYRLRNFFHSEQIIIPSANDLSYNNYSLLPYAKNQWFFFSLEGGGFVAFKAPNSDFFRKVLPNHLKKQYFLLFLITLHQRFVLMGLSHEVSKHWLEGDESERLYFFRTIRDRHLVFTARGFFSQIMQQEHHHTVYRKCQEVFQLDQIYQEVSNEIQIMHDELQLRLSESREQAIRNLERFVTVVGMILGIPTIVLTFLGVNISKITVEGGGLTFRLVVLMTIISFFIGIILFLIITILSQNQKL
ncbi:MAG: hypothetical protein SWO11_17765 [Thermodesulfobacteriota bacterium]|nr:hypothetical protein [Thermodesulfobacteriota bacterium]